MKGTALGTRKTSLTPVLVTKCLQPEGGHSRAATWPGHCLWSQQLLCLPRTGVAGRCVPQTRPCLCTELKSGGDMVFLGFQRRHSKIQGHLPSQGRAARVVQGKDSFPNPRVAFSDPTRPVPDRLGSRSSVFWALYDLPPTL